MKTKIYSILFFTLTLSCALIFNSCSKDSPTCIKHTYTFTLSDDDKSKVPYTGTDTLVFISNTNDTIKCVGAGKVAGQDIENGGGSPDCPPFTNTNYYEFYSIKLNDNNSKLSIAFEHHKQLSDIFYQGYYSKQLDIIRIVINNNTFYIYLSSLGDISDSSYVAQRVFNGKIFNNLTYCLKGFSNINDTLFFSPQQGIVHFTLDNGTYQYTLNK